MTKVLPIQRHGKGIRTEIVGGGLPGVAQRIMRGGNIVVTNGGKATMMDSELRQSTAPGGHIMLRKSVSKKGVSGKA